MLSAQMGDVSYVMARVPGVAEGGEIELGGAALGVVEAALPLEFVQGLQQHDPTGVDAFDGFERPLGRGDGVGQLGEGLLVVAGNYRPIFREGFAETMEGGHVRVGDVMDELADGPAVFTIGGIDLRRCEVAEGLAEQSGHLSKGEDGVATIFGCDAGGRSELADGIARVG